MKRIFNTGRFSKDKALDAEFNIRAKTLYKECCGIYGKEISYANGGIDGYLLGAQGRKAYDFIGSPWQSICNDDHVSFWKNKDSKKIAISQPYHLNKDIIYHIHSRCERMCYEVLITGGGWHFPDRTFLVVYTKK